MAWRRVISVGLRVCWIIFKHRDEIIREVRDGQVIISKIVAEVKKLEKKNK